MDTKLLSSTLGAFLIATCPIIATAQQSGERHVRIEITRKENGKESHVTREFDLNDERQLADALKELGVMDEMNLIGDDENLVIDLRRMRDGGLLNDMSMALSLADMEAPTEPRGYLGVYHANWNASCDKDARKKDPPVKEGACVTNVVEGTPAERIGLKDGDVIIALDGRPIKSGEALGEAIAEHKPGDTVELVFYRGKEKRTVNVTLAAHENDAAMMGRDWSTDSEAYERAMDEYERAMEEHWRAQEDRERAYDDLNEAFHGSDGAFLGVDGEDLPDNGGVRITNVVDSSAAERMGLMEGDTITAINGEKIDDFEDLADRVSDAVPGADATVTVMRDGREVTLTGSFGRRMGYFRMYEGSLAPFTDEPFLFRMPNFNHGDEDRTLGPEQRAERDEMRREMDELRREMNRLRRDLRGDVVREMRVTVDAVELSPEESELLKNKGVTGLDNALDLPGLRIAPNPTGGAFDLAFQVPERGDLTVDVHDAQGDRVYHETISGFKGNYARTLDMSDRAAGTYSVVIAQNGKALARKVVKH